MSLFSNEEVCEGCLHAVFHDCCKSFCRCKIDGCIDVIRGECEDRPEQESKEGE